MFHRKYGKGVLLLSGICFFITTVMIGIALFSHSWNGNGDNEEIAVKERQWPATKGAGPQGTYVITRLQGDIPESSDNGDEEGENITKESGEITLSDIMVVLDAYNEYIDQAVKNQLWEVDSFGGRRPSAFRGCDLIYVDNEDIPVVFIYEPVDDGSSSNYIILTYDGGQVHEQVLDFFDDGGNPYSIPFPDYLSYSDGENFGPVYKTVYDSYFGKILKFNHILGCFINPLVALDSWEPATLCSEFMLMSLTYGKDIAKYYPDANMLGNQISISEEDVSDYLMHTIGVADISEWMQYMNQGTNDFQIDIGYIDGEYNITVPWSFFERHWEYYLDPVITDIKLLSDSELQISGLIENYLEHDKYGRKAFRYTYFTVHMALDADSVWNYRLIGIDRWDSYMLPYARSKLLCETEVHYLTTEQLEFEIKEIYARHGMIFKDKQVQEYFENCNWYNGTVPEVEFDDSVLTVYEYCNVQLLTRYLNNRDCNWYDGMFPELEFSYFWEMAHPGDEDMLPEAEFDDSMPNE